MTYVTGWIACIRNLNGSRFANGRHYLYSAPFSCETLAKQWAQAFDDCELLRVESNDVPKDRIAA